MGKRGREEGEKVNVYGGFDSDSTLCVGDLALYLSTTIKVLVGSSTLMQQTHR